jgi:hypothetical protein
MGDVVRLTIFVNKELKVRMDQVGKQFDWSAVASDAFNTKLLELESGMKAKNLDDVAARMKAADELEGKEEYQAGFKAGQQWAKDIAKPKQLRRLERYIDLFAHESVDWFDVDGRWDWPGGCTGALVMAVLNLSKDEVERHTFALFWEKALGEQAKRIEDAGFFHGFGDGALDMWVKVQGKVRLLPPVETMPGGDNQTPPDKRRTTPP